MTIICGLKTKQGIIMSSDSLVTRQNGDESYNYINKSKKITEANILLKNNKNEEKEIKIGIAFAGNVTFIDSLKSRNNIQLEISNINFLNISLLNIVEKYKEIYNTILFDHIIDRYEGTDFENPKIINQIKNDVNVEILFFGYCNKSEDYQIIEMDINNFSFKIKQDYNEELLFTIGTKKKQIKKILIKQITNFMKDVHYSNFELNFHDITSFFNTQIMNFISNKEYKYIGGSLISFMFSNYSKLYELIEFLPLEFYNHILESSNNYEKQRKSILYSKCMGIYRKSGIMIKSENIFISGTYFFNYNPSFLNKENYIEHQIETKHNKKRFEIYNFMGDNSLKIKKIGNKFKIITHDNIDNEDLNTEWKIITHENDGQNLYQNFLLNDIIKNTNLLTKIEGDFYIPS